MKTRTIVILLGVLAASVCRAQGNIQQYSGLSIPTSSSLESLREPPEPVLTAFVEGLKAGPVHTFARGLEAEKVEPEVEKWSKDLGVPLKVQSVGFLKFLLEFNADVRGEPGRMWAAMVPVDVAVGRRLEVPGLIVESSKHSPGQPPVVTYRLPSAKLKELDFRFVRSVTIENPLNKVLDRYAVSRRPLSEVMVELCRTAGVDSANRDEAAAEAVSVQLNRKSIIECLRLMASVGGKTIKVEPQEPYDGKEGFESVFPTWTTRQFLNEFEKLDPPLDTPLDVLRHLVAKRAAMMKETQQVVLLLPKEGEKK